VQKPNCQTNLAYLKRKEAIVDLIEFIKCEKFDKRFVAIRLLEEDEDIYKIVHEKPWYVE
jgi:ferrous iron transport protein B